jgi:hypothetical protein
MLFSLRPLRRPSANWRRQNDRCELHLRCVEWGVKTFMKKSVLPRNRGKGRRYQKGRVSPVHTHTRPFPIALERFEAGRHAFIALNGDVQIGWCVKCKAKWYIEDMDGQVLAGPFPTLRVAESSRHKGSREIRRREQSRMVIISTPKPKAMARGRKPFNYGLQRTQR